MLRNHVRVRGCRPGDMAAAWRRDMGEGYPYGKDMYGDLYGASGPPALRCRNETFWVDGNGTSRQVVREVCDRTPDPYAWTPVPPVPWTGRNVRRERASP
eukprot:gene7015-1592_t